MNRRAFLLGSAAVVASAAVPLPAPAKARRVFYSPIAKVRWPRLEAYCRADVIHTAEYSAFARHCEEVSQQIMREKAFAYAKGYGMPVDNAKKFLDAIDAAKVSPSYTQQKTPG